MSSGPSAKLKLHTEDEWEVVRPIIERLYLREHQTLSTVMTTMQNSHQFKATIAMYKRWLRIWGLQKNRPRISTGHTTAESGRAVSVPRYLAQNDVDEGVHSMLDLFSPWITQTYVFKGYNTHLDQLQCPPRAQYIYNTFTNTVAVAAAAFENGDPAWGSMMRRAFIYLEPRLAPEARSAFTLSTLFFAVAILDQAGLPQVSRMLISHAAGLVLSRYRKADLDGNEGHPFPKILQRLQRLSATLDDTPMMSVLLVAWVAYHGHPVP